MVRRQERRRGGNLELAREEGEFSRWAVWSCRGQGRFGQVQGDRIA